MMELDLACKVFMNKSLKQGNRMSEILSKFCDSFLRKNNTKATLDGGDEYELHIQKAVLYFFLVMFPNKMTDGCFQIFGRQRCLSKTLCKLLG